MRTSLHPMLLALGLMACGANQRIEDSSENTRATGEDTAHDTHEEQPDPAADTADEIEPPVGFGLVGLVADRFTDPPTPAAAGLCVMAADPSPAMVGGDLEILATGVTEEDGTYALHGIETNSTLGIVVIAKDCDDTTTEERTMYPTGTGIAFETYNPLVPGEVTNLDLHQLRTDMLGKVDTALSEAGHLNAPAEADGVPSTMTEQGGIIVQMLDVDGSPVPDATIQCAAAYCPTYYNAAATGVSFLGADGLATSTGADGLAFLPGAPITHYTATHDTVVFESRTMGSLSNVALVVQLSQLTAR